MKEVIEGIGLFLLILMASFAGMFCALWMWTYASILYVKKLQDKLKSKQDEKRKKVK